VRAIVIAVLVVTACAPTIDGPLETQRAADRDDAVRVAAQLAALPGAVRADVTLRRPIVDPLTQVTSPASAAVLVVVDDRADRAAIARASVALVRGTAPEILEPAIVVELGATRPQLVEVGPFTVEAGSRRRVVATLAAAFAVIAALAGWLAWRERWRLARVSAG
jgi:type III secretory pathway lipoprotein EscJ